MTFLGFLVCTARETLHTFNVGRLREARRLLESLEEDTVP